MEDSTKEIFERYNNEYLKFALVEDKRSARADLHAFFLLDELFPGDRDLVSSAEHDVIYLDISLEEIERLTEDQIIELVRCGILYNEEVESLYSFV